jgi:hypothetical protein
MTPDPTDDAPDWLDAVATILFVLIVAVTVLNLLAMFGNTP